MSSLHRRLLFLLGVATYFEGYGRNLIGFALPYIGRDLQVSESALGFAFSLVSLGALGSLVVAHLADRWGRKRLLLLCIAGFTLAGFMTGWVRDLAGLVAWQIVAFIFLNAALGTATVIVTEEFPAAARGFGQGVLGILNALGPGLVALLLPIVQPTRWGWRWLCFIAVVPVLFLPYLHRALPETSRWTRLHDNPASPPPSPWAILNRPHRSRLFLLITVTFLAISSDSTASTFVTYHAVHVHGWSAGQVSAMIILAGAIGLPGWLVGGRLSDRIGRKATGAFFLVGHSAAICLFYLARSFWLPPAFALHVFFQAGKMVVLRALATELFPTSMRATAAGWLFVAATGGAVAGLAAVGAGTVLPGRLAHVISLLALAPLLAALVLTFIPETRGKELEILAPERR